MLTGNYEEVATYVGTKYPNKKVIVVKHGYALPLRVFDDHVIMWLDYDGSVRKTDIF